MNIDKDAKDWTAQDAAEFGDGIKWALLERWTDEITKDNTPLMAISEQVAAKGYPKGSTFNLLCSAFFAGVEAGFNFWFDVTGVEERTAKNGNC